MVAGVAAKEAVGGNAIEMAAVDCAGVVPLTPVATSV
jgi:hypothetical protein